MGQYDNLNLNDNLISNDSPIATSDYTNSLEFGLNTQIPLGAIDYSNMVKASKTYTAVISLAKTQGAFQDIQEALNYVNQQGGGRILVLPGQYVLSKSLTMYSNISIEGVGRAVCIIDFNSTTNNLFTNGNDIEISNLSFQNSTNSSTGAINASTGTRLRINKCAFNNNTVDVYSTGSRDLVVEDCTSGLITPSATFYSSPSAQTLNYINRNTIISPTSYVFLNCSGHNITNNYISAPGTTVFYGTASQAEISGNQIVSPSKYMAEIKVSNYVRISNNVGSSAIVLGTVNFSQISGNTLYSSFGTTPVISVIEGDDISIVGNYLTCGTHAGIDGISFTGAFGCSSCVVTGNSIRTQNSTSTGYAVNIAATSTNIAVVGNKLSGRSGTYQDLGSNDVVANNS